MGWSQKLAAPAREHPGEPLSGYFCDVFELDHGKVQRLTSYLMTVPASARQE